MKQLPSRWSLVLLCLLTGASACSDQKEAAAGAAAGPGGPPANVVKDYPILTLAPQTAELHTDYPTVLQGQSNVEIRPKVEGFIDQVLVDEGHNRLILPIFKSQQ